MNQPIITSGTSGITTGIAGLFSAPRQDFLASVVVEERSARRNLLQQLGRLHEQQVQQRELVTELIPAICSILTFSERMEIRPQAENASLNRGWIDAN